MVDYHFTACGLDNVWLTNGFIVKETPYGPAVSVIDADALLRALCEHLIQQDTPLTAQERRFLRMHLGLSQAMVAAMQGVEEQAVAAWERNDNTPQTGAQAAERDRRIATLEGDLPHAVSWNVTKAELAARAP